MAVLDRHAAKVPTITLGFWISDRTVLFGAMLVVLVWRQIRARAFRPWL